MCPSKKISDRTYRLGSKIRQKEGAGGGGGVATTPMDFLPIFLTMKMPFNLDKFWYGVRLYQGELVGKFLTM